ncbi:aminoglycoside phosphotransferase family protein [Piscinibacter sakaiensis]|uniref:aminoglycoside phosphotransferase family protein n=1 Tax=Piscinibacter sakaiensis TaxID=1547922 RepID=UPI003AB0A519
MLEPTPTPSRLTWPSAEREAAFADWLESVRPAHQLLPQSLRPASADASFRRYLRIDREPGAGGGSLIVMDAPPPQEDVRPFVAVAGQLQAAGLHAPRVLAQDAEQGFLLLSDLGQTLYLQALGDAVASEDRGSIDRLMRDAATTLLEWQQRIDPTTLPPYDATLLNRELSLFPEWCVERELGQQWTEHERAIWDAACSLLVASALAQPTLAVHRDYMPRNLMVTENGPGILDFQDAVNGPVSYDLASLLRDAFISWDEEFELDIAVRYWEGARKAGLPVDPDFGEFWRQVEWMGLQRHLKVLGIFCRLKHRDGKPKYSEDLPRFFAYAHHVAARYSALRPLSRLLELLMGAQRIDAFY